MSATHYDCGLIKAGLQRSDLNFAPCESFTASGRVLLLTCFRKRSFDPIHSAAAGALMHCLSLDFQDKNSNMTVSWNSRPNLVHICLLLCATGAVSGQFQLEPQNLTVLRGSDAQFNATVPGVWDVMTWNVGGFLVLTIRVSGDVTSSSGQFSAGFCSMGDTSCVEFTIHNVSRGESGPVLCSVLGDFGSKTAQLYVQESGSVSITGGNLTVVQDKQVEFQCVSSAWFPEPTVTWTRNGRVVSSDLYNTSSMADGDSFNSTSVLKFQAVSNTTVECQATVSTLRNPESSSVFLVVVPQPTDWTVLIAVVVSFGGFALLVLLIIGIIFCYKRRKEKEPNYQDEMSRRVRTLSQLSAAGQRQGQVNAAYLPEGQTSVPPSENTDSGYCPTVASQVVEMPHVGNSNQEGDGYNRAYNTVDDSGFRKHRHVTIV
ncbi:immunoglobulin superfamily member 5 [Centropristis striata]|uniref:immunoglobulin superfamily member 5 n=1 Tax=Centropristis striata TaxID=184440 RepID=UPI0027DFBE7D|nr:immunoglobulin superfamily member 5 [Centropristis striata]